MARSSLPTTIGLLVLLGGALPLAGHAQSVTAQSIWDAQNAIQRATEQVPKGATVTRSECTDVNVRTGNDRYICTVYYTRNPQPAPAPNGLTPTN